MVKKETTTICVSIEVWRELTSLRNHPKEELNDVVKEALFYLRKERMGVRV